MTSASQTMCPSGSLFRGLLPQDLEAYAENVPTTLDLSDGRCYSDRAFAFATTLTTNTTLTSLNLKCNLITDVEAAALALALTANNTLTSLNLEQNLTSFNLGQRQHTAEGVNAFPSALRVNSTLTSLNLCYNRLTDESAMAFATALTVNSTLTSLDLSDNPITDAGAEALAAALSSNSTLTSLALTPLPGIGYLQLKELVERNGHNSEARDSLQIQCTRAIVRDVFSQIDEWSQRKVYEQMGIASDRAEGDFQLGDDLSYRQWSKFAEAVRVSEIDLGRRTIEHYQLRMLPFADKAVLYIETCSV